VRLWSLHPRYLDPKGLTALWREALLARAVLRGETIGYRSHPQLERFAAQRDPVADIERYLHAVLDEARARGYRFDERKLGRLPGRVLRSGRIPVTRGQLAYELAHLKRKLKSRNPTAYRALTRVMEPEPHPLFRVIEGGIAEWEKQRRG
jgi:hypothetical protein